MKYQVYELENTDETDEITISTLEDPQPILVEPSWPVQTGWPGCTRTLRKAPELAHTYCA